MKYLSKITFSALCAASILSSACAELNDPVQFVDGKEVSVAYAAKVVNSEEDADRTSLLLFLADCLVRDRWLPVLLCKGCSLDGNDRCDNRSFCHS